MSMESQIEDSQPLSIDLGAGGDRPAAPASQESHPPAEDPRAADVEEWTMVRGRGAAQEGGGPEESGLIVARELPALGTAGPRRTRRAGGPRQGVFSS